MRKIWDWLVGLITKVSYDKWLHCIAGLIIAAFFAIVIRDPWCIAPVAIAGVAKEVFDLITTKKFDWKDLVATVAGGLIIQVFVWIRMLL